MDAGGRSGATVSDDGAVVRAYLDTSLPELGRTKSWPRRARSLAARGYTDRCSMSKSGAKTAKTDAVKASRKRPDPEGLRLIEEGEKAFEAKDFVAATERFVAAKAACKYTFGADSKYRLCPVPKEIKELA